MPDESQPSYPVFSDIPPRPKRGKWLAIGAAVLIILAGGVWYVLVHYDITSKPKTNTNTTVSTNSDTKEPTTTQKVEGLQLDTTKNYGNKYSTGIVPVGDSHYVSDAAKQGYIYVCHANFVPSSQAGAQTRGPWFVNSNTQYDLTKKAHIQGHVTWNSVMSNVVAGNTRTISTNDLPTHYTGVFPVATNDPAAKYDRNPNQISSQSLTYALNANPVYGSPNCVGGEVGVMLTGVALFDGFDAGGRDAGAWEVQDDCAGHPQNKGEYHYHSLSSCITDINVKTVLGFALDGFPITGPKVGENNILTTSDLDECHGLTSEVMLDGKKTTTYHYVMTQDFPYSVSCFRSQAIQAPGVKEGPPQPGQ